MVHARWAVACLLSVVLFVGIAAKGSAEDNAVTVPPPPQAISQAASDYRMGPEDQIRVSVWENAQLTLDLVVRPDGKISMPLIQDV
ncbi:MAG: polysaccharide biosynthesis/export family protein, partial [Deltaproteobacteria bacterium]|nr:polysaccharide biosynthesis/export family protein [Deltaproteobacteria bacterium]